MKTYFIALFNYYSLIAVNKITLRKIFFSIFKCYVMGNI